ncbi:flagellar biosynthesis protein FliJ, partial [Klebsiella pneumoniae]|nr:flagellar biosynthesis protein FliJ [Klebsiella pneumoniae]
MVMLRDMAQEKLTETTRALGSVQQTLMEAVAQHEQLQHYEREYQQSLRQGLLGSGMSMADLVN